MEDNKEAEKPSLPASLIIQAAGGEEPNRKQIRDLEKLKMSTQEVILTAFRLDIENYIQTESDKRIRPVQIRTNEALHTVHSLQNKINYVSRDIIENKHLADQKIAKLVTHEEFSKVVMMLEDKV